jgi:HD-GYP domain-containing protein (c-di-GMP phosphodiesterase class II)
VRDESRNGVKPIIGLNVALDERDAATHDHCDRVSGLSLELGRRCGLSERELRLLQVAAWLHDVGKIGIPDTVLKKPAALDAADWAIMKTHPVKSERIVLAANLEEGNLIAEAVRHHHERIDGRGYPDGLAGEAIPVLSRIVAIADTYDAMSGLRIYGPPQTHSQIMKELTRVAGTQHDAYLSALFAELIEGSRFRTSN